MKKFLVVLLSLGLVMAFSMSAFAVTPDFTGQYYARGSYISNPSLLDQSPANATSWGYYDQRLRMFMRLKIVEGVTFTTRMDALETIWGQDQELLGAAFVAGNAKAKDFNAASISFEQSYVDFATGIGQFRVGYRSGTPYGWGTKFMDASGTAPGFGWSNKFGNLTVLADVNKNTGGKGDMDMANGVPNLTATDVDKDYYDLGAKYKFKTGEAGLLWTYFRNADKRTDPSNSKRMVAKVHNIQPYVIAKLGPIDLEAEAYWMKGTNEYDAEAKKADVDINTKGFYVNGKYNMGPAYVGAYLVYASGDDPTTPEKEGSMNGTLKYGQDTTPWGEITPAIMFGDDYHDYLDTAGAGGAIVDKYMDNVKMVQLYGGYAVTKKFDLNVKASFMKADKVAAGYDDNYGKELDVKATYKIYDKLTYNIGAAYLWTGDYFKGTSATAKVDNNYLLQHWIDLRF